MKNQCFDAWPQVKSDGAVMRRFDFAAIGKETLYEYMYE